jgi:hypothetical protein
MPTKRVRDSERRRFIRACDNCQRRKQRCDGMQPCGTCRFRKRSHECFVSTLHPDTAEASFSSESSQQCDTSLIQSSYEIANPSHIYGDPQRPLSPANSTTAQYWPELHSALIPQLPRALEHADDEIIFVKEYSTLSFLQDIRDCVQASVGKCAFVDGPSHLNVVEDSRIRQADWLHAKARPCKPDLEEAASLVRHFTWATSCIVDIFDESVLLQRLPDWIYGCHEGEEPATDVIYYLIAAIGAQASRNTKDEPGRDYLNYGRYLTALHFGETSCITTAQCHTLITWYLLSAGRKTVADSHIATATQVAYALGLHRSDHAANLKPDESMTRQRLWKSIRVLDGHLSLALGRPSFIYSEKYAATINGNYSACLDLCVIFDSVASVVYARRMVSTEVVNSISAHHRRWTACFREGLAIDHISSKDYLKLNGIDCPNIGLYHVKEAFYWTITLLTLPFLLDWVSRRIRDTTTTPSGNPRLSSESSPSSLMVDACVSTAVSTIEMLQGLEFRETLPKKMPFIANSVLVATLTMGVAVFGDLDHRFPLERHLRTAKALLIRLGSHDAVVESQVIIVGQLQDACQAHVAKRAGKRRELSALQFERVFGKTLTAEML